MVFLGILAILAATILAATPAFACSSGFYAPSPLDLSDPVIGAGVVGRDPRDSGPVYLSRDETGSPIMVWPSFDETLPQLSAPVSLSRAPAALPEPPVRPEMP